MAVVTGYLITLDGVPTDYGLTPLNATGLCGCSITLPASGGQHTVMVSAYNATGQADSTPFVIGPTANAGGPYNGQVGVALVVDGSGSADGSGAIVTYAWDWGDGTSDSASSSDTHTYTTAGTFTVTLTVSDAGGPSVPVTTTATIANAQTPLVITCPVPTALSLTGGAVAVTFAPTVAGGTPPLQASCSPSSGSAFPVGVTPVNCTATDALSTVASCQTQVTVRGCTFTVSPGSQTIAFGGSTATASVTATSACAWTATSNASWITVTGGASASGNGTVAYTVAANASSAPRTGTLTVANHTVTVTQHSAPQSCSFTVSPTSQTIWARGGTLSASVTTTSTCGWTAMSHASWITISAGATGTGHGIVRYSVSPNRSTASRTGTLTVAGHTVTITQHGGGH